MKKAKIAAAFAVVLFAAIPGAFSVRAQASPNGCLHSNNNAAGCAVSMPEPSEWALLATGLIAVGALAFFGRKRLANRQG